MNQPFEEAGTEKLCPTCGSWKVFRFVNGYYICHGCKKLLEMKDIVTKQIVTASAKVLPWRG